MILEVRALSTISAEGLRPFFDVIKKAGNPSKAFMPPEVSEKPHQIICILRLAHPEFTCKYLDLNSY